MKIVLVVIGIIVAVFIYGMAVDAHNSRVLAKMPVTGYPVRPAGQKPPAPNALECAEKWKTVTFWWAQPGGKENATEAYDAWREAGCTH